VKPILAVALLVAVSASAVARAQEWNRAGLSDGALTASKASAAPAPKRDLTGIWDAGGQGIAGPGHESAPWTDWTKQKAASFRPGNGPRAVYENDINDPLSTVCDPTGFPRQVLYETRPFQIVQTPTQVLILYMFEKRWRVVWTDGRALPKDPDQLWMGTSVGKWIDDHNFQVETVGFNTKTWLDRLGGADEGRDILLGDAFDARRALAVERRAGAGRHAQIVQQGEVIRIGGIEVRRALDWAELVRLQAHHREAAFERPFRAFLAAARGPPRSAAPAALVALEALLHRLGHQIDDVLVLANPLRTLDLFLRPEDADQADAFGMPSRRLDGFAQAIEALAGSTGRLGDRLVEKLLDRGGLGLELRLRLSFLVGVDLGRLGASRRRLEIGLSLPGQVLVRCRLFPRFLGRCTRLRHVLGRAGFAGLLDVGLGGAADHRVTLSGGLLREPEGGGAGRALRARLREHRRGILVGLRGDAPGDRSGRSDARQLRRKTPAGFHLRLGGHADDRPAELGERLHVNTR